MHNEYPRHDNQVITLDNPRICAFIEAITRLDQNIEAMEACCEAKTSEDRYLTDKQAAELLKISRRMLFDYRTEGALPYYMLGRKILYKMSDIRQFMEKNYIPAIPQ